MIRETATAAEVREAFLAPDAEQAIKEITAIIDGKLDMETTFELMEECIGDAAGKLDKDAKPMDRLAWITKQAYLFGFSHAATIHYEAAEASYKALFYGEGEPCPAA